MKIFGIDTSTRFLSIGVGDGDTLYEYGIDAGRMHSQLLIPSIERILQALGWQPEEVDYFACGAGPGSFTGVRIAAATVKGLAYSLRKPVIAVSSLDVIAHNALGAGLPEGSRVIVVVDAKRNLVYSGVYAVRGGHMKRQGRLKLTPVADVLRSAKAASTFLGDGLLIYHKEIAAAGLRTLEKDYWYPTGRGIIRAARASLAEKKITDAFRLTPLYLYPKDCQVTHAR